MRLAVRDATAADLPAIVALMADDVNGRAREDASEPLDPRYRAAFGAIAADPNQRLILATLDGAPAGTLQLSYIPGLSFKGAWRCLVEAVRIASDRRGEGLGEELIRWAIGEARERGCTLVQLTSQNDRIAAHRFYERLGFAKSHTGFKLTL